MVANRPLPEAIRDIFHTLPSRWLDWSEAKSRIVWCERRAEQRSKVAFWLALCIDGRVVHCRAAELSTKSIVLSDCVPLSSSSTATVYLSDRDGRRRRLKARMVRRTGPGQVLEWLGLTDDDRRAIVELLEVATVPSPDAKRRCSIIA